MATRLDEWSELEADEWESLILGNGASIAVDCRFKYGSLLETARATGFIPPAVDQLFKWVGSDDFELVLRLLWHAHAINSALGETRSAATEAYQHVRAALVAAVRANHALHHEVEAVLPQIGSFMSRFSTVVSLNYDLIVYWAMMHFNHSTAQQWFKDGFVAPDRTFQREWAFLRNPLGTASGATLVFFPHGALMLARRLFGQDCKIARDNEETPLLDSVFEAWGSGEFVPLFVSEGDSAQKLQAVHRSDYLSAVWDSVLPEVGSGVVVYGWSMGGQDDHLVHRIFIPRGSGRGVERVAVSVHRGGRSNAAVERHCEEVQERLVGINRRPGGSVLRRCLTRRLVQAKHRAVPLSPLSRQPRGS